MATGRIGTTPVLQVRWSKAPSAGTTSLSGTDDNSVTLVYSVGYEAVYRNGVLLSRGNDYTATNGTTVTLVDATIAGDIIEIFANQTVPLTDTYSQSVANAKYINNTLTTTTGDIIYASSANTPARLGIGSTNQVLTVASGIPSWATPAGASGPAFSVTRITSNQSLTQNTYTKLQWNSEDFDTANAFDSTTNYRFTPLTAGYYQINVIAWIDQANPTFSTSYLGLFKNGSIYKTLSGVLLQNYNNGGSAVVYLNGSTDYLEVYGYSTTATGSFRATAAESCFSGVWIRS